MRPVRFDKSAKIVKNKIEGGISMNAEDRREMEAMFRHYIGGLVGKIDAATEGFKSHVGILTEDFQHKLDIVVEGHEVLRKEIREVGDESNAKHGQTAFLLKALSDKVGNVDTRISARIDAVEGSLSAKLDAVAGELAAHRKDTEAHRAAWRVKENGE
jgi:hypothetical protein